MTLEPLGTKQTPYGFQLTWVSTEAYCSKLLVFERQGAHTDLIFHRLRTKSWFINAGEFEVTYIDVSNGSKVVQQLTESNSVTFDVLSPHRVSLLSPNGVICEVSTADYQEDRYMLEQTQEST